MEEQEQTSLWQRFRRLLGAGKGSSTRDEATERNGTSAPDPVSSSPAAVATSDTTSDTAGEARFATHELRDRVVVMLLFDQAVRVRQVAAAWHYWQDDAVPTPDTLWRVVALLAGVDREAVYTEAARVYAFDSIDFNMYSARSLIRKYRHSFSKRQWARMVALNIAPVKRAYDEEKDAHRWIFATHDPARPAVKQFLMREMTDKHHVLRYAPQEPIEEVFDDALPHLARKRPDPRTLPEPDKVDDEARRKSRRYIEELAPGATDAEVLFRRAASQQQATKNEEALGEESEGEVLTPAQLFSEALAGLMKNSAHAAYFFSGERGSFLEIYHRRHRRFEHWRTEPRIGPDVMVDFASGHILSLRQSGGGTGRAMERWVGGRRVDFRLSIKPASALAASLPVESGTEVVVVEVDR